METDVIQEKEVIKRAREEIEKKTGKTPEQLYDEREKRVRDAIAVKEPDRVPVVASLHNFPFRYAGLPLSAPFYDPAACRQAYIRILRDFDLDICEFGAPTMSGLGLEAVDPTHFQWPGGNLPPDYHLQWGSAEMMKEDEYDVFITDPTDFILRYYLPRAFGTLAPFSRIPSLVERLAGGVSGLLTLSSVFTTPELQGASQALQKAWQEEKGFDQVWKGFDDVKASLGFPPYRWSGGLGPMPFDLFASHLRGMRGVMVDMYRRPQKLITACERVLEWRLARAVPADPKAKGYPRRVQASGFHYAADNFLSKKQFETFCWPTYKKSLLGAIELGFIPTTFCEGRCNDRLEYFLELPKGKLLPRFEELDMARAKEILGGHICIMGNVPAVLLQVGSAQEVEEYCRNLIKICGKGGGFILAPSCGLDDPKPANLKAMIDSAKKYGQY